MDLSSNQPYHNKVVFPFWNLPFCQKTRYILKMKRRALKKQLNWGWSKDAASSFTHLNKGRVSFQRGDKWLDGSYFSWKLWKACKGCHYKIMLNNTTLLQTRSRVSFCSTTKFFNSRKNNHMWVHPFDNFSLFGPKISSFWYYPLQAPSKYWVWWDSLVPNGWQALSL